MKYILYGASRYMRERIDEEKIKYFDYIVDRSDKLIGTKYLGKEIKAPDTLLREDKGDIFIVITAHFQLYSIEYDLKEMGFERGKNFDWLGRLRNHYPKHALWLRPASESWKKDEQAWREFSPNGTVHERAELVAKMIGWTDVKSVLDLGAGSEPMRPLLPKGVVYYPVDYKRLTGNTLVFDFNQKQFPELKADVVILVGVHGYVDHQLWLIDQAVNALNIGGQLIISFNYSAEGFNVLEFIIKYQDIVKCVDFAYRDRHYGIFRFKKLS